ncbi:MAG: SAV_915 family protein [Sporichthyaceae bacterium]
MVYAPVTGVEGDRARLEMQRLADGRTALFVYSAMDRLERFYREDAPWVVLEVKDLQSAHTEVAFDVLFLDRRPNREASDSAEEPAPEGDAADRDDSEVGAAPDRPHPASQPPGAAGVLDG